jgi:hypothetical protein
MEKVPKSRGIKFQSRWMFLNPKKDILRISKHAKKEERKTSKGTAKSALGKRA